LKRRYGDEADEDAANAEDVPENDTEDTTMKSNNILDFAPVQIKGA